MFFNNNQQDLEGLTFKYDHELQDRAPEEKEKIPMKELFAIILAQYSIMLPIAFGAVVVFGILLFLITLLM